MKYKGLEFSIKGIDEAKGVIEGYASAFDNIDSDGDVIIKGAFAKTITERGPMGKNQIFHLAQHNSTAILGKPLELFEDDYGLRFVSQISKTTLGMDYLQLYLDGIINEHSIGFNTVRSDLEGRANVIKEVKLWEYSAVTWGANSETPTLSAKNAKEYATNLMRAVRNGKYTDETFELIEMELAKIMDAIKNTSAPSQDTQKPLGLASLDSFINVLKTYNGKH